MLPVNVPGGPLTERDYETLKARAIGRESDHHLLRRVSSLEGGEIVGRNGSGDYSGIAIPYILPGENRVREHRVRRDNPECENGKPKGKYLSPPGRGNLLYIPVGVEPAWLTDTALPLWATEGEFKAIALMGAAQHGLGDDSEKPRALPVSFSGVFGWRGTIGKVTNEAGVRVDEKGPIADLLNHCIGKCPDMWTQVDKNRAGRCLRALGFELKLKRTGRHRDWRYLRNA